MGDIFDARTAIIGLYLWLLFGYLSTMISCDIKKLMNNDIFRHVIGIIAFFFLFTLIDTNNDMDVKDLWKKTIIVYIIFLLMTKSKWYYSIPVLILLVIDQSLKGEMDYIDNKKDVTDENKRTKTTYEGIRKILYKIILVLIFIGFIDYMIRQYLEYGNNFSFLKLMFTYTCKK